MKRAFTIIACLAAAPVPVEASASPATVTQLFSYRLTDPVKFHDGYCSHLRWHAEHHDKLPWYAWTVQAGPRRGLFLDGTAGVSLADLDARPDPAGDGANFAATAGPHAQAVDIETWELLPELSTATPLEEHKPAAVVDAFLLDVLPAQAPAFERGLEKLRQHRSAPSAQLTWYRKLRGGTPAAYMVILSRSNWADIAVSGGPFNTTLAKAYGSPIDAVSAALVPVTAISSETWKYKPRLSLFPERPPSC